MPNARNATLRLRLTPPRDEERWRMPPRVLGAGCRGGTGETRGGWIALVNVSWG